MLRVRAIQKYHDAKGILLGYTIQNVDNTSEVMTVTKEGLKNAIMNGQAEVVNMTLTSDGRLIGKAAPEPKKRQSSPVVSWKAIEVFNIGKDIIGAEVVNAEGATRFVSMRTLNGISISEDVKKKAFKSVYAKVYKKLQENVQTPLEVTVAKESKDYYIITWDNSKVNGENALTLLEMCITFCVRAAKIRVEEIEVGCIKVYCGTGIADVRKALKDGMIHKL